ncbi:alpha/beta hydrolase [Rhodococcus phenolicus]|uniref:alpha/beta hydrolase n=1 Tax=Rhodococcus phenolicus TaxID=263849 RepID=UPI0008368443|nr:prolyl oligopeptidase family serine peptidase [Rhodococcus phenolicus]
MEIPSSRGRAHVLVLPGGMPSSTATARWWHPSQLRMALLTESLRLRLSGTGITVRQVLYTVRGWNGEARSPVQDGLRALDEIRRRRPDAPIGLVGHSMGGRAVAYLAAQPQVEAVVALAPWWPDDEAALIPPGRRLLVAHGTADRRTDPSASAAQTEAARRRGVDATWQPFPGAGHFLLTRPWRWHAVTADFLRDALTTARAPGGHREA